MAKQLKANRTKFNMNINYKNKIKNKSENELMNKLQEEGWIVTKRGFPDFACFKDDKFMLVEVKPDNNHKLKTNQYQVMKALSDRGIECYKWTPGRGFIPIY